MKAPHPADAVLCDRSTPYGNQFRIGALWRGKPMTRDDVCNRFEAEVLPHLDVSALRGKDLLCHCAPKRCHCDSIIAKANRNEVAAMIEVLAVIDSPHFHAGIVLWDDTVIEAAPIVGYMKKGKWSRDQVRDYCKRKAWTVSVVHQIERERG